MRRSQSSQFDQKRSFNPIQVAHDDDDAKMNIEIFPHKKNLFSSHSRIASHIAVK